MPIVSDPSASYVGRVAPSPTGYLHLGHARTFWVAWERARRRGGKLLLRNDDLDRARCRDQFVRAMQEDLRWLGLDWDGPIVTQSQRLPRYRAALATLHASGLIFPCTRSRRDVEEAASAPHEPAKGAILPRPHPAGEDEPIYPRQFRPPADAPLPPLAEPITVNWRFRVPDDLEVRFWDGQVGEQSAVCGRDFGDFLVWRKDDTPSYQLATVVDDAELGVTEVVRGADLIKSTFRQMLLFAALGWRAPSFFHAPLMLDDRGQRLAKRHDALSLRTLRTSGVAPETIIREFARACGETAEKV